MTMVHVPSNHGTVTDCIFPRHPFK
uniref:Uncharacterized protein n=1 Tax=Arundo donax TaxID=35708 RepID=A0A0A8YLN2_ARUDO